MPFDWSYSVKNPNEIVIYDPSVVEMAKKSIDKKLSIIGHKMGDALATQIGNTVIVRIPIYEKDSGIEIGQGIFIKNNGYIEEAIEIRSL